MLGILRGVLLIAAQVARQHGGAIAFNRRRARHWRMNA